jgi:hypothetical protein
MRGIHEKPIDSGIWLIHYYAGGASVTAKR